MLIQCSWHFSCQELVIEERREETRMLNERNLSSRSGKAPTFRRSTTLPDKVIDSGLQELNEIVDSS